MLALFRDDVFDAKMYALVAVVLRLQGVGVVLKLPSRRATRAHRLFSSLRLGRVIFDDEVSLTAHDEERIDSSVKELTRLKGFDAWSKAEFDGHQVGPLILSTVIRETENGHPADDDEGFFARVRGRTRAALQAYCRSRIVLDALHPEVVVVQEPGYDTNGPLVDVAVERGTRCIHVATSWRNDALLLKALSSGRRRVMPQTVERETLAAVLESWSPSQEQSVDDAFTERYGGTWSLQATFQAPGAISDVDIRKTLGVSEGRRIAVIFSHVIWDATFWAGEDLYRDYAEWFLAAVRSAISNPSVHWVIKTHPANAYRHDAGDVADRCAEERLIRENFGPLPDHVTVLPPDTKVSALALYRGADIGLTVRGSPGFEMACFGKPVLTAGTGAYVGLGFTIDSVDVGSYERRLASVQDLRPIPEDWQRRARAYALALFRWRPWRLSSFSMEFKVGSPRRALDRNIRPRIQHINELSAANDLRLAGEWMTRSRETDYVERP